MIVKSSQRAGYKELAKHLASDENEEVRVVGTRYSVVQDIAGALEEFEAVSRASNCRKHLFHVSISPEPDQAMTEQEWKFVWRVHEQINGLTSAPYIEIEHKKEDRFHRHRVYERVDAESGKAINLSWTRMKNERLARHMECKLGHPIVQGRHNKSVIRSLRRDGFHEEARIIQASGIRYRAPRVTRIMWAEKQQIERGHDLAAVRAAVADSWATADCGEGFEQALRDKGLMIAQGDKVGVVVAVDADGHVIPLLRAINVNRKAAGLKIVKKKELLKMIPSLDKLPDVDAVRERMTEMGFDTAQQENVRNTPTAEITRASGSMSMQMSNRKLHASETYSEHFEQTGIARYWKIDCRDDGSLVYHNQAGSIHDTGNSLNCDTRNNTSFVVATALILATLKGWNRINVSGTDEFKSTAYRFALQSNIEVQVDNENDLVLLERERKLLAESEKINITNFIDKNKLSMEDSPAFEDAYADNKNNFPRLR